MTDRDTWQRVRTLEELQDLLLVEPGLFAVRRPALETAWRDLPLAFFDVETTGLAPEEGDRIVELAIERTGPDWGGRSERSERFVEIFDPERPIPRSVRRIHSIRPAQTRACRTFAEAVDELLPLLDGAVWVGHNLSFDIRFLRIEMRRCGRELPAAWVIDTLLLSRRWCDLPRHTLEAVASHLGHGGGDLHRALDDVRTSRAVLASLIERIVPPPRILRDLLRAMLPAREGGGA